MSEAAAGAPLGDIQSYMQQSVGGAPGNIRKAPATAAAAAAAAAVPTEEFEKQMQTFEDEQGIPGQSLAAATAAAAAAAGELG